jgi:hypothetical protein
MKLVANIIYRNSYKNKKGQLINVAILYWIVKCLNCKRKSSYIINHSDVQNVELKCRCGNTHIGLN